MEEKIMSQEEFMNIKLKDTGIYNQDYSFYNYCIENGIDTIKYLYDLYDIESLYFEDLDGFLALLNFKYLNTPVDDCLDMYTTYDKKLGFVYDSTLQRFGFNKKQSDFLIEKIGEYQALGLDGSLIVLIKTISQVDALNSIIPNIVDVAKLNVMSFEMDSEYDFEPKILQTPEEIENDILYSFLERIECLRQDRMQIDKEIHLLEESMLLFSKERMKQKEAKRRTLKKQPKKPNRK